MKLYIGNIPFETTEQELTAFFESVGTAKNIKLIRDKKTKLAKGFGFAEFENEDEGNKAIEHLNGIKFGGRELIVKASIK